MAVLAVMAARIARGRAVRAALTGMLIALPACAPEPPSRRGGPGADAVVDASPRPRTGAPTDTSDRNAPGYVVDSIRPMAEELRRFQEGLPAVTRLAGGAATREQLAQRFVDALARRDTAALHAMALSRAEFAHLVFPSSEYARPPYRTPPGLLWMQLSQSGSKGLTRLLRDDLAVRSLVALRCAAPPVVEGGNTLWRQCRVAVGTADGTTLDGRLFGVIVERQGHFKFVNYDTDF